MNSPFLMLPPSPYEIQRTNLREFSFYSLQEKKTCTTIKIPQINEDYECVDYECVGSSHGWLAFLNKLANPLLIDPFSETRLPLPLSNTLPTSNPKSSTKIKKIILSSNPHHSKNYAVVVLFGDMRIAFCRGGDEKWSDLDRESKTYYDDVVICNETNTAFAVGPGISVASWDLNQIVPQKKMVVQNSCPRSLKLKDKYPVELYASQWYLALLQKEIYFVVRYIGHHVRYDGKVVYEGDTLTDEAAEPLVCPYKTVNFYVFKLDGDKWIKVETLDNSALFLGGNQSTMLSTIKHPELEKNAIYFTDDFWERMDEDYMYGGHDMGIFKLEDGTIHHVLDCQPQKIVPPPFWIIKST